MSKSSEPSLQVTVRMLGVPSLGYEDDTTLSKISIAQTQLVEAINLFVSEKFICAVTLAGAAEEILGKLIEKKKELPVIRESLQHIRDLQEKSGLNITNGRSDKQFVDEWNEVRNSLKHLVSPDADSISINLCDGAYWIIKRALANAKKLSVPIENEIEFENWVIINVNL